MSLRNVRAEVSNGKSVSMGTDMRATAWKMVLATVVLIAVVEVVLPSGVAAVVYPTIDGTATLILVVGAWQSVVLWPVGKRAPAVLIASGLSCNVLGWQWSLIGLHPAISLALSLTTFPLIFLALIDMARRRAPGQLLPGVLDAAVISTAIGVMAWQAIAPIMVAGDIPRTEVVAIAVYAFLDFALLMLGLVLILSPGSRGTPSALAIGAAFFVLTSHIVDTYLRFTGREDPPFGASLALVGIAMLVAALLHPRAVELITPVRVRVRSLHPARMLFLGAGLLTAPASVIIRSDTIGANKIAMLVASVATSVFVLTRFAMAVREQERAQRQIVHQADHDGLTGLLNRTAFHRVLGDSLADAPLIMYLDLDGFKAVNDAHGHEAGDAVLVAVAQRLRSAVRSGDVVARLGGDEFAALLTGPNVPDGDAVARRLIADIAEPVPWQGRSLHVGTSVGATTTRPDEDQATVLRRADTAMYQAKRHGKGRLSWHDNPPEAAPLPA